MSEELKYNPLRSDIKEQFGSNYMMRTLPYLWQGSSAKNTPHFHLLPPVGDMVLPSDILLQRLVLVLQTST